MLGINRLGVGEPMRLENLLGSRPVSLEELLFLTTRGVVR